MRVDSTRLAAEGHADERAEAARGAEQDEPSHGVGMIGPALHLVGGGHDPESAIAPEDFRARVSRALATGEVAWDPYD